MFLFVFLKPYDFNFQKALQWTSFPNVCIATNFYIRLYLDNLDFLLFISAW